MRTLRVLLPAAPEPERADAWALYDDRGRMIEHGRDVPARWPSADRREAVIDAEAVRIVALALPPLPRDRLVAAATFAIEERIATPGDASVVVVGERDAQGQVEVIVVARDVLEATFASSLGFVRAIAEPQLALPVQGWRWCERDAGGFVRTASGEAFAISRSPADAIPIELAVALAQATREGRAPAQVFVERAMNVDVATWTQDTGVAFVEGEPWRWEAAPARAFDVAVDLFAPLRRAREPAASRTRSRLATAAAMAMLALALHVAATVGTWAWQRYSLAEARSTLAAIARDAGANGANAESAVASLDRLHADARHRAGLAATDDAMPMLARAAPALAALPPDTVRTATWTGGAWTIEIKPVDEPALAALSQRLAAAGLVALHARTQAGIRLRLSGRP